MTENAPLKDSGNRREFESGAVRDRAVGKGRYDLISPHAMRRLAKCLEKGASKYTERNWEKGMPVCSFVDSALRHTFQYLQGKVDEDHLGQALWNLHAAIHTEEEIARGNLPESLDDLPTRQIKAEVSGARKRSPDPTHFDLPEPEYRRNPIDQDYPNTTFGSLLPC